jgi:hypothetical protein
MGNERLHNDGWRLALREIAVKHSMAASSLVSAQ